MYVKATISLVKDYGLILDIADGITGFILNDNLINKD